MEHIKQTFAQCKKEGRVRVSPMNYVAVVSVSVPEPHWQLSQPALVTYVTAGYPTVEGAVDVLLGLEAGGAGKKWNSNLQFLLINCPDVIEMGLPFTDPIADGPTIQKANTVSSYYDLQTLNKVQV